LVLQQDHMWQPVRPHSGCSVHHPSFCTRERNQSSCVLSIFMPDCCSLRKRANLVSAYIDLGLALEVLLFLRT
jgi:hypothetical protein